MFTPTVVKRLARCQRGDMHIQELRSRSRKTLVDPSVGHACTIYVQKPEPKPEEPKVEAPQENGGKEGEAMETEAAPAEGGADSTPPTSEPMQADL